MPDQHPRLSSQSQLASPTELSSQPQISSGLELDSRPKLSSLWPLQPSPMTSFRMFDGRVRNFQAHLERLGLSDEQAERLRAQLRELGPAPCNPRVEVTAGYTVVQPRPDRPLSPRISVWARPINDPRQRPTIKGPDLFELGTHLATAQARGADEGVLVSDGRVIEGIYSAILVLRDHTVEYSAHPATLPSTTVTAVLPYLTGLGFTPVPVTNGWELAELRRSRVWFLNAFSGVRAVTHWVEYGTADRAEFIDSAAANAWLWDHAEQV